MINSDKIGKHILSEPQRSGCLCCIRPRKIGEGEEPRGKRGRRVGTLPNQHGSSRTMNGNHWQKVGWRNVGKGREVLLHQVTERMYN